MKKIEITLTAFTPATEAINLLRVADTAKPGVSQTIYLRIINESLCVCLN